MKIPPGKILVLLIIFNLIVGWIIAPDFGRTTDEDMEYLRATAAWRAYFPGSFGHYSDNEIPVVARQYGTALTMLAHGAEQIFQPFLNSEPGVIVHYVYFLFFQMGITSVFYLTKKFSGEWVALLTALLFSSQPLLFGHAFINPKDTPLLSIYLAAVALGVYMVDKLAESIPLNSPKRKISQLDLKSTWNTVSFNKKKSLLKLQLIWPALLGLYILIKLLIPKIVGGMFVASKESFSGKLLNLVVTHAPGEDLSPYVHKAEHITDRIFLIIFILSVLVVLAKVILMTQPLKNYLQQEWLKPVLTGLRPMELVRLTANWRMLAAAVVWGLCISTRVVGVFSGAMVGLYMVFKLKWKVIGPGFVYTLIALMTAYITWPQFWVNGLSLIIKGLTTFSSFFWDNDVLFKGELWKASQLPRGYLPFYITVQFTLPLILLAVLGIVVCIWRLRNHIINWQLLLIVFSWFALPLLFVLVTHPRIYNNGRQFLFITPPLFILSGIGLEAVWRKLGNRLAQGLIALIVLIPGLLAIVQLHPYEYIYFNELVGGVSGAFREYELDYFAASTTEAIKFLNRISPENSTILFWGVGPDLGFYAREDLVVIKQRDIDQPISNYDFAIVMSKYNADLNNLTSRPTIYTIEADGAILAVVKEIRGGPDQ